MNTFTFKRGASAVAALGVAALVLSACAAAPDEPTTAPATEETTEQAEVEEVEFLACAVSDEGSFQDKSFNESVLNGLEEAQERFGVEILALESASDEDFDPNMQQAVDNNCDITFAVGFKLADVANRFAENHPDMNFALVDDFSNFPNLKQLQYAVNEAGFLAGYLSAAYSTTKIIGTYGGMNFPSVTAFMDGFYYGAQLWSQDSGQPIRVLGWDPADPDSGSFVGDFSNTNVALQISQTQIEAGADVILPVAGGLFSATAEAIGDSDVVMLGVDLDVAANSPEYKDIILTSVEKGLTASVVSVIEGMLSTGFDGTGYLGTLANGGTLISPLYDFESKVDQSVLDRLAAIEEGIIAGTISVTG